MPFGCPGGGRKSVQVSCQSGWGAHHIQDVYVNLDNLGAVTGGLTEICINRVFEADLIRCGFSEGQATAAARRCSSIEAAVAPRSDIDLRTFQIDLLMKH